MLPNQMYMHNTYTQTLCAREEVMRKPKKSDLEDLKKAHAPMTRALFEQYNIILLDSY